MTAGATFGEEAAITDASFGVALGCGAKDVEEAFRGSGKATATLTVALFFESVTLS